LFEVPLNILIEVSVGKDDAEKNRHLPKLG